MLKKILKKIIIGDPYADQKRYVRMAQKKAKAGRAIDVGVASYQTQRYGKKKLSQAEKKDIMNFKKEIMTPQKKKTIDSIISDFIPNPQNVGRVDMNFGIGKKSRSSDFSDLATFK